MICSPGTFKFKHIKIFITIIREDVNETDSCWIFATCPTILIAEQSQSATVHLD